MSARMIPLSHGFSAIVDEADYDALVAMGKWRATRPAYGLYAVRTGRRADGRKGEIRMHKLLVDWEGVTDHINGNGLDNRRANLRPATPAQNNRNTKLPSTNTSGYRGVSWCRTNRKWRAAIQFEHQKIHLGYHATAVEAAIAYDIAVHRHFGEFARPNFPLGVAA